MINLEDKLSGITSVGISGHVRPDGDCVGSTMAVYNYIATYHPEIAVDIYLESIPNVFHFLRSKFQQIYFIFIIFYIWNIFNIFVCPN